MLNIRLVDLANRIQAEIYGNDQLLINKIASIKEAKTGQIAFLLRKDWKKYLPNCKASAIVLKKEYLPLVSCSALIVDDPYLAYAKITRLIYEKINLKKIGIELGSIIAPNVKLGKNVSIGTNTVVESKVVLGKNVTIGSGCFIGKHVKIDDDTCIFSNVTIHKNTHIGKKCSIQSNSVIGSDGFGYINKNGNWIKIYHFGTVIIGDQVEIGSCTTIDRGSIDNTYIGNGVIIDNHCHIAHNTKIGSKTAIAGGVIIAGSTVVGENCMIGGASVINGHIHICNKVTITGMSMVMRSIDQPGTYSSGIPVQSNKIWRRKTVLLMNIDKINKRMKILEQKLQKINHIHKSSIKHT